MSVVLNALVDDRVGAVNSRPQDALEPLTSEINVSHRVRDDGSAANNKKRTVKCLTAAKR